MRGRVIARELRVGQREVDVVAPVDREIVNAALVDGVGGRGTGGFNHLGFRTDGDNLLGAGDGQGDGKLFHLTDGDTLVASFYLGEAGSFDSDGVDARRQSDQAILAVGTLGGAALKSLGLVAGSDRGASDHASFLIFDNDVEIAAGGALRESHRSEKERKKSERDEVANSHGVSRLPAHKIPVSRDLPSGPRAKWPVSAKSFSFAGLYIRMGWKASRNEGRNRVSHAECRSGKDDRKLARGYP